MIRFHGGPITPEPCAVAAWSGAAAMISFANPEQVELAFAVADQVALDNGAWPIFAAGEGTIDAEAYLAFVENWRRHPAFAWCLIPDKVDGTEEENTRLIERWPLDNDASVPVWHMHESLDKLGWLCDDFPRVAIGSSGDFVEIGTQRWWNRVAEAMGIACDGDGLPKTRLHGLRQMDPTVFSAIPYASVDSTNVARNIGIDKKWPGRYSPRKKETRAIVLRHNINSHASAARWNGIGGIVANLELYG
jgi:hypothetical protein